MYTALREIGEKGLNDPDLQAKITASFMEATRLDTPEGKHELEKLLGLSGGDQGPGETDGETDGEGEKKKHVQPSTEKLSAAASKEQARESSLRRDILTEKEKLKQELGEERRKEEELIQQHQREEEMGM
jgi:hypothetical protein